MAKRRIGAPNYAFTPIIATHGGKNGASDRVVGIRAKSIFVLCYRTACIQFIKYAMYARDMHTRACECVYRERRRAERRITI